MSTGAQRITRARRYRVPNNEQAIISIGEERMTATLDCLSLTGGRIRSTRQFAPGTFGSLEAQTVSGRFAAVIEMLGKAKGSAQAFRFVQMGPNSRSRLRDALNKMEAQGCGEKQQSTWYRLFNVGRGILTPAGK